MFWYDCQKCILPVQKKVLGVTKVWKKCFKVCRKLKKSWLTSTKIISVGLSKLHFTCPKERFSWENFRKKSYKLICFSDSEQEFFNRFVKVPATCPQERFGKKGSFENFWIYNFSRNWSENFSDLQRKSFVAIVTTAVYKTIGTFLRFWKY